MATYDYMTSLKNSGRKVQVESAKRDGDGKNIANNYAKQVGYYEGMGVGTADNLTPYSENSGIAQHEPFVFQSTAGGSDVGALCQLKSLRGQSYVLNQTAVPLSSSSTTANVTRSYDSDTGITSLSGTADDDGYITISNKDNGWISGHKYLIKTGQSDVSYHINADGGWSASADDRIISVTSNQSSAQVVAHIVNGTVYDASFKTQVFDLTLMFGAGNEPTSVEEFNRLFPLSYYAYNAGELVSCQASKLITVGYNQFDEQITTGYYYNQSGAKQATPNYECSTNLIRVIPSQTYVFERGTNSTYSSNYVYYREYDGSGNCLTTTTDGIAKNFGTDLVIPDNVCYIGFYSAFQVSFGATPEIAFHLTWDGSKTGYEPYAKHEYGLPNEVLRSAGSAYDEIKSNGTKITRIALYTITGNERITSTGTSQQDKYRFRIRDLDNLAKGNSDGSSNIISSKYEGINSGSSGTYGCNNGISITLWNGQTYIEIYDENYTGENDGADLLASLVGMTIYYEMITPVESDSIAFQENIAIDDWGTMEFVSTYPQGNDFFYYVDYKAFIDSLGNREDIGFDASEIVSQEELTEALADVDLSDYAKVEQSFKVIKASEIGVGNVLTTDQLDLIISSPYSRPILVQGAISGNYDALLCGMAISSQEVNGIAINGRNIHTFNINRYTRVITFDSSNSNEYLRIKGTNVNDIINGTFNVINASDIGATFTEAQRNIISNGKPTLIMGTFLTYNNLFVFNVSNDFGGYYICLFKTETTNGRVNISCFRLNMNTGAYAEYNSYVSNVIFFGKQFPAYPTTNPSPQALTIATNGGNLSWSDDGLFNVINASDIVNNTLTQAQYDLITNGKPTLISGSFLSRVNGFVLNLTDFGSELAGTFISGTYRNVIRINKTTHVCSRATDTIRYVDLASILKFNGKEVPAYPSNTGTFVLKCVDGVLTWVQE